MMFILWRVAMAYSSWMAIFLIAVKEKKLGLVWNAVKRLSFRRSV